MRKAVVLALLSLACGKQTFLAAAFVQTPALPNPGLPSQPFPQFQVLTAYFGTIDTSDPTQISAGKLATITNASASVAFHHAKDPAVSGDADEDRWLSPPGAASKWQQSSGTYTLSSNDEPKLTFEPGVPYTLILQLPGTDGEAFGARLTPGPPEDIVEFETSTCAGLLGPTPRCADVTTAQIATAARRTFTRDLAAGAEVLPAFVLVGQVNPNNPAAEPNITYKTIPDNAEDLLKYVLSDQPYRQKSFTVPTSAFPGPGYYIVTVLTVKQGKVSSNAFLGSTALSATGTAGVYHVQ